MSLDVFAQFLEARTAEHGRNTRPESWADLNAPLAPPARLLAFDAWVRAQLSQRLQWPSNPAAKARQIEQCPILVETLVLDLWRRGWMLDGKRLAVHITAALSDVAAAQGRGGVRDLYAYLKHSLNAYVGANAEEIQAEARRHATGHVGVLTAEVLAGYGIGRVPSMPELVAMRREEIAAAQNRPKIRAQIKESRKNMEPEKQTLLF